MRKNGIYACQNVVETWWKHGDMILCYLLFFLNFNLIKTAAKFMRNESVKCPARVVFAKSRARHVHIMSLNLLTSHLNYSISRVSYMYVHWSWTTDESLHYFVLPSEKQNAFARSADFEFQLILYLGPSNFWSEIVLKNWYR